MVLWSGMVQTALSRSIWSHVAFRTSPLRAAVRVEELQGVDSSRVGPGGFNGSDSVPDLAGGKGFVVFRTVFDLW